MLIRKCKPEDYKRIQELNKYAFGYEYPIEKTKHRLSAILNMPTELIVVACVDDEVVGYIHGSDYECTYADPMKNIMAIAVDEKHRNQGIGKALLDFIEEDARKDGRAAVRLVSGFNRKEAHAFYQACRYTLRKEQKNFIKILE
jgi:(aminoalkyl)phosphonate N-acetyltransferase